MNHFTWTQYLETLAVLLIIYYVVILAKFYVPEIQQKINGAQPATAAPIGALQYTPEPVAEEIEDPLVMQTEQLIGSLKGFIQNAPSQPAAIATGIREIFKNYEMIKDTQLRPAINELVVTECEKKGAALLTEAEVNEWW